MSRVRVVQSPRKFDIQLEVFLRSPCFYNDVHILSFLFSSAQILAQGQASISRTAHLYLLVVHLRLAVSYSFKKCHCCIKERKGIQTIQFALLHCYYKNHRLPHDYPHEYYWKYKIKFKDLLLKYRSLQNTNIV